MLPVQKWPKALRGWLNDHGFMVREPVWLHGIGSVGAYRCFSTQESVVAKVTPSRQEYAVYSEIRPRLTHWGVSMPETLGHGQEGQTFWWVMEDVPRPLPKHRWQADPAMVETLFRLHARSWQSAFPIPNPFRPQWTDETTLAAVSCFDKGGRSTLAHHLALWKQAAIPLLNPCCWISGDPNPTNWGIREDGAVVLFDWERFGLGTPAIDLAITMPGLGSRGGKLERSLASYYIGFWERTGSTAPYTVASLAQSIRIAKVWSSVDFLGMFARGILPSTAERSIQFLQKFLPQFLDLWRHPAADW